MDFMVWNKEWELGIDVIDQQHRQIVDYINELSIAIGADSEPLVLKVLQNLSSYTLNHFAFEEQLMVQANYVGFIEHEHTHRNFEIRVTQLKTELYTGRDAMGIARKARNALMVWLIEHIKHEDAAYAPTVIKYLHKDHSWIRGALRTIFG